MELNESELRKIVAGIDQQDAEQQALENKELYRESSIEKLQKLREQINDLKTRELTMEELEQVKVEPNMQR